MEPKGGCTSLLSQKIHWLALKSDGVLPKKSFRADFYSATVGRTASDYAKLQPKKESKSLISFVYPSSYHLIPSSTKFTDFFCLLLNNLSPSSSVSHKFFYRIWNCRTFNKHNLNCFSVLPLGFS